MESIGAAVRRFIRGDEGATSIEYALLASFIAVAIVSSVTLLGTKLDSVYATVRDAFK